MIIVFEKNSTFNASDINEGRFVNRHYLRTQVFQVILSVFFLEKYLKDVILKWSCLTGYLVEEVQLAEN